MSTNVHAKRCLLLELRQEHIYDAEPRDNISTDDAGSQRGFRTGFESGLVTGSGSMNPRNQSLGHNHRTGEATSTAMLKSQLPESQHISRIKTLELLLNSEQGDSTGFNFLREMELLRMNWFLMRNWMICKRNRRSLPVEKLMR